MDFITKLPPSKDLAIGVEYNSILTVVDQLTKWSYFFPCKESWTVEQLADIIYRNIALVYIAKGIDYRQRYQVYIEILASTYSKTRSQK